MKLNILFEAPPVPGSTSDRPSSEGWKFIDQKEMTFLDLKKKGWIGSYADGAVEDIKDKNYTVNGKDEIMWDWEVMETVMRYAKYLKQDINNLKTLPPIQILNNKFVDGSHRMAAIAVLALDDPKWNNAILKVDFYST